MTCNSWLLVSYTHALISQDSEPKDRQPEICKSAEISQIMAKWITCCMESGLWHYVYAVTLELLWIFMLMHKDLLTMHIWEYCAETVSSVTGVYNGKIGKLTFRNKCFQKALSQRQPYLCHWGIYSCGSNQTDRHSAILQSREEMDISSPTTHHYALAARLSSSIL